MTGPLLRSGSLIAYHPMGAVGHPVYLAAAQLRAAIARRLGAEAADTFAIPQRSEDGDTIDWYAPKPGRVVPWTVAGADERALAQAQLLQTRERIEDLGRTMQGEADPERQVFGRLLAHVTNFPDEEHIYLVEGRPVVTFWGFVRDRAAVGQDPLVNLDRLAAPPTPPAASRRRHWWWLWVPVLLLLLLAALYFALRTWYPEGLNWLPPDLRGGTPTIASEPERPSTEEAQPPAQTDIRPETEPSGPATDERDATMPDRTLIERRTLHTTGGGVVTHEVVDAQGRQVLMTAAGKADTVQVDSAVGAPSGESTVDLSKEEGSGRTPDKTEDTAVKDEVTTPMVGADTAEQEPPADTKTTAGPESETTPGPDADSAAAKSDEPSSKVEGENPAPGEPTAEPPRPKPEPATVKGPDAAPAKPDAQASRKDQPPPAAEAQSKDQAGEGGDRRSKDKSAKQPADKPADQKGTKTGDDAKAAETAKPSVRSAKEPGVAGPAAGSPVTGAAPTLTQLRRGWQTATSLQDPKNGLPIQMEYQSQDGKGQLRLKRSDGSVCETDAGGEVQGGKLVIDSSGDIRCADGTNFGRPRVECEAGRDGKPRCQGRYPNGAGFSIDVRAP